MTWTKEETELLITEYPIKGTKIESLRKITQRIRLWIKLERWRYTYSDGISAVAFSK